MKFILSAMMVSRAISYYICMIVTGLYTLVYHAIGLKNVPKDEQAKIPDVVDVYSALSSDAVLNEMDNDGERLRKNKSDVPNGSDGACSVMLSGQAVGESDAETSENNNACNGDGPKPDCGSSEMLRDRDDPPSCGEQNKNDTGEEK